jgi:DNA mismatch repair protein MutS2
MNAKTLEALEFPKIIAAIVGQSLTPYGSEHTRQIQPLYVLDDIRCRLAEAQQMRDVLLFGAALPLERLDDIRGALKRASVEGSRIEADEFRRLKLTLAVIAKLKAFNKGERENMPNLAERLEALGTFTELKDAIERTFDKYGEIRDTASGALRKIRNEIADTRRRIIDKLERALRSRTKSDGWQDDVVTQRNNRYVIPVQANLYRASDGILVDHSQSGATVYIEPPFAVELNNQLTRATKNEQLEIERILIELTTLARNVSGALLESLKTIGVLDSLHAQAQFAVKTESVAPAVIDEASIDLLKARHPLLLFYTENKDDIIPLNLALNESHQGILITGPNTGGKTVALKTVGLLTAMTQSGLLIPADERSTVGIFSDIFADIGDEQSLELSLSTFSSHITRVIEAVKSANERTLLLFDEIGAGTDPAEGAALAEAIILEALAAGARMIATTHYSQLKTLPLEHAELENCSLEFDRESLQPTYRLLLGLPGSSYAIEIAERLGMPPRVIERASAGLDSNERSLAELIATMEAQLKQMRADSATLSEKLTATEDMERQLQERLENHERELNSQRESVLAETDDLLTETRQEIERLVKEIRESAAEKSKVKEAHRALKEQTSKLARTRANSSGKPAGAKRDEVLQPGDQVWISSLRISGEIAELVGKDRVRVRVGNILNLVKREDVLRADVGKPGARPRRDPIGLRAETAAAPEIHLRGLTVEEAKEKLDKFLDRAVLSEMSQIYVIHGKGSGALRKSLTVFLKSHPVVKSVQIGDWNQGGAGVTVVQMK